MPYRPPYCPAPARPQMVEMVHHLHTLGVMHRDIKPENFLLTDDTEGAALKACDFGLSDFFKPQQQFSALIGSAYYVVRVGVGAGWLVPGVPGV